RRRHTRFSRDWSSDVCSSDLAAFVDGLAPAAAHPQVHRSFDAHVTAHSPALQVPLADRHTAAAVEAVRRVDQVPQPGELRMVQIIPGQIQENPEILVPDDIRQLTPPSPSQVVTSTVRPGTDNAAGAGSANTKPDNRTDARPEKP